MLLYGEKKNLPHFPDLGQGSLQKDVSKYFISQVEINFQMFLKTKQNKKSDGFGVFFSMNKIYNLVRKRGTLEVLTYLIQIISQSKHGNTGDSPIEFAHYRIRRGLYWTYQIKIVNAPLK